MNAAARVFALCSFAFSFAAACVEPAPPPRPAAKGVVQPPVPLDEDHGVPAASAAVRLAVAPEVDEPAQVCGE
jgi:hypothetical protein